MRNGQTTAFCPQIPYTCGGGSNRVQQVHQEVIGITGKPWAGIGPSTDGAGAKLPRYREGKTSSLHDPTRMLPRHRV